MSTRYEVSGIYEFSFLDPSKATIQAPLPPFLSCSLADDARRIVSFKSDCIAFPNKDGTVVNPFTGDGVSDVECCGTTTSELVSVGGFRPDLGAPVRP